MIDEDYLILSTIHSAKGQEWRNVFRAEWRGRLHSVDLGTGSEEEIDEERRLLYVAMTRAKEDLAHRHAAAVLHARAGRARRPPCLCFAHPLHPVGLFQQVIWPPAPSEAEGAAAMPRVPVDIAAKMRGMWK
jgi:DNA helicase-2/ATP-dependent DNA helicase PcrA